jgi:hypothetical protein
MKKNLRNVLVLSLGLITTIASAQWSANSTTWIDNTDSDNRSAETRSTVTMDMSGVHISADYNWSSDGTQGNGNVYEAYVSTDVMGFGTLTLGRQDLSFGSGAFVSSNQWGWTRYTTDGADFAANFGGVSFNAGTMDGINTNSNYINASGSFSGISLNALMIDNDGVSSTGYDLGYSMMDGKLTLSYSMNDANGAELTVMGGSYNVMDNVSIHASMREYSGTGDFVAANSAWGLESGNLGHQANGTETTSYGGTYSAGSIGLSYTMHTVSLNGTDTEITDMGLSYDLNDNCTLGYRSYNDMNYITIGIGL